ncbi:MAG: hypothetical protein ACOCRO_08575 [Halanaerobiales bacterium]
MSEIEVIDELKINFLNQILSGEIKQKHCIEITSDYLSCKKDILLKMIKRFLDGKTSVLPCFDNQRIIWLILNDDYRELINDSNEIENFLCPYYAKNLSKENARLNQV